MKWLPWRRMEQARRGTQEAKAAYRESIGELNATVQRWPEVREEAERQRRIYRANHFAEAVEVEMRRRRAA